MPLTRPPAPPLLPAPRSKTPGRRDDPDHGPSRSSSAHEGHFLSRALRCQGEDLDRAMRLYHNSHAVRVVLEERLAQRPDVERVAIPLRAALPSPHVVVTRGGRFVTCLGEEMRFDDMPRVPYRAFAEAMDIVEKEWAQLQRRKTLLARYDGEAMGAALMGGPGSFHRRIAESYIEGGRFGQKTCEFLIRALELCWRFELKYIQGQLRERRQIIEYTKLQGRILILCYTLAGIRSEGVAGVLEFLARYPNGYEAYLMMALSYQDRGDERLLRIAADPEVPPELRAMAVGYALASLGRHRERADETVDAIVALPADPATAGMGLLQEAAATLREEHRGKIGVFMAEAAAGAAAVRPAAASWLFTPSELLKFTTAARPALELFPPEEEAEAARAAWDELVGTRVLGPPPRREPVRRSGPRVGRNEPCPCGSGRKHKQCCLGRAKPNDSPPSAPPQSA